MQLSSPEYVSRRYFGLAWQRSGVLAVVDLHNDKMLTTTITDSCHWSLQLLRPLELSAQASA